jgi:hypothetical protein
VAYIEIGSGRTHGAEGACRHDINVLCHHLGPLLFDQIADFLRRHDDRLALSYLLVDLLYRLHSPPPEIHQNPWVTHIITPYHTLEVFDSSQQRVSTIHRSFKAVVK